VKFCANPNPLSPSLLMAVSPAPAAPASPGDPSPPPASVSISVTPQRSRPLPMETERLRSGAPAGEGQAKDVAAPMSRCDVIKRVVVVLVILGVVAYVTIDSFTTKHVIDGLESFLDWVSMLSLPMAVLCQPGH